MDLMDAVTGYLAQLIAKTGLNVSSEAALASGLVLIVVIVAIALLFSRRGSRLEERFADPSTFQPVVRNAEVPAAPDGRSNSDSIAPQPASGGTTSHPPDSDGYTAQLGDDLANLHEGMASLLPSTRAEFMAVQESVQNYQERIELLRTTLNSMQSEQLTLHKLME